MKYYLNPNDMQSVLSHDARYRRAIKLLFEKWSTDENHLFSDLIKTSDIVFARKLQQSELAHGRYALDDYQQVQEFIKLHEEWLTPAAKKELLDRFN